MPAGKCFLKQVVVFGHQDAMFRSGWNLVNYNTLKDNRLMYALTRHTSYAKACFATKRTGNCDKFSYMDYWLHGYSLGYSQDVFMLYMREEITPEMISDMHGIRLDDIGMEHVFAWMMKEKLKYKLLNPCLLLQFHHQHCVPIRNSIRNRINNDTNTVFVPFTSHLEP